MQRQYFVLQYFIDNKQKVLNYITLGQLLFGGVLVAGFAGYILQDLVQEARNDEEHSIKLGEEDYFVNMF